MTRANRVAVITDTISPSFYFTLWHKYYARQFGASNLYILTYDGLRRDFNHYQLGGVWESDQFNNNQRVKIVSALIDSLLARYDYVIRVDTDEFLVPHPSRASSLEEYMNALTSAYVTAEGYDVVQDQGEGPLDLSQDILVAQRSRAYPFDALNKTCITKVPMRWAPGFHFSSVYPVFDSLAMFHLKRADIEIQVAVGEAVAAHAKGDLLIDYHLTPREQILIATQSALNFPRLDDPETFLRPQYRAKFLSNIAYTQNYGGVYHGTTFAPEPALVRLPDVFRGAF